MASSNSAARSVDFARSSRSRRASLSNVRFLCLSAIFYAIVGTRKTVMTSSHGRRGRGADSTFGRATAFLVPFVGARRAEAGVRLAFPAADPAYLPGVLAHSVAVLLFVVAQSPLCLNFRALGAFLASVESLVVFRLPWLVKPLWRVWCDSPFINILLTKNQSNRVICLTGFGTAPRPPLPMPRFPWAMARNRG